MAEVSMRDRIVDTAMRLFSRRGYAAVGLNEIVEKSGAPKGSLYHYFPNGKEEIAVAAMRHGADLFLWTVAETARTAPTAAAFVRRLGETLAGWMEGSKFRDGCPLTALTVEIASQAPPIRAACRAGYADWRNALAALLRREGRSAKDAAELACWIVASFEGAMVLARAEDSAAPIRMVTRRLAAQLTKLGSE